MQKSKLNWWLIFGFTIVPLIVSFFSTIHVIEFFKLTNPFWMAIYIAIAFEIGALAALAGLVAIDKINKNVVWAIFFLLTAYQMMGNTYAAYDFISNLLKTNPDWIKNWTELFGMEESEIVSIKRIIAISAGAIFPIISLCFLDILITYIMVSMGLKEPHKNKNKKSSLPSSVEIPDQELNSIKEVAEEATPVVKSEESTIPVEELKDQDDIEIINDIEEQISVEDDLENQLKEKELKQTLSQNFNHTNFKSFLENKSEKVAELRQNFLELLAIFYENGNLQIGQEGARYTEFLEKVDLTKTKQADVNLFFVLCNYLEIIQINDTARIALKSYDHAINILTGYLDLQ